MARWPISTLTRSQERKSGPLQTYIYCTQDYAYDPNSKSELKKRMKQREQDQKKAAKAATAPPKVQKHTSAEEEESHLTPNVSVPTEF